MTKRWLVSAVSIALLGGGTYFYLQSAAQPELLPTLIVEKGTIENKRWLLVNCPCTLRVYQVTNRRYRR